MLKLGSHFYLIRAIDLKPALIKRRTFDLVSTKHCRHYQFRGKSNDITL